MVDLRELEEGVSVGGVYTLERWIRNDSSGTFFAALTGDGERLLIKLAPERGPDAEPQLATWQRSRNLRHPHLQDLRDVGRSELPGGTYIYSVYEYPEDVLASALEQGPLSEADTLGVLDAALAALRYLHGQGLVHGSVDPDHIVAIGEVAKLTTDGLRESDDLEGCAEDVRQLGEMVRRLRAPEPLNEPLATIARHATACGDAESLDAGGDCCATRTASGGQLRHRASRLQSWSPPVIAASGGCAGFLLLLLRPPCRRREFAISKMMRARRRAFPDGSSPAWRFCSFPSYCSICAASPKLLHSRLFRRPNRPRYRTLLRPP